MIEYPILHIAFFIVMALSPEAAERVTVVHGGTTVVATRVEDGWRVPKDGARWSADGTKVTRELRGVPKTHDVGRFVGENIAEHDWKTRKTFINNFLAVHKTADGFEIRITQKGRKATRVAIRFEPVEAAKK